jgi:iron complex transport system ATP-binding protein
MSAVLEFSDVHLSYGARQVLNGISCSFAPGEVTGLIGPNGAGKTTLLRLGLGLLAASGGEVTLLGRPLRHWDARDRARALAYLPQSNEAHWPMLARRVVALGRLPHEASLQRLGAADKEAISRALERCDAGDLAERRMDGISAGERARVLLARALATEAPVLVADEPAAHLDPGHQLQLMRLLREEAGRGTAVCVTLHDLALAVRFCDRLLVMKAGRIVATGTPASALSGAVLAEVFGVGALRLHDQGGRELLLVQALEEG